MSIVIQVKNAQAQIFGLDNLVVIDCLSKELSYIMASAKYSWVARQTGWDGSHRLLSKTLKFPSGCLERVCKVLDSFSLPYEIKDTRQYVERRPTSLEWTGYDLYDYQKEIVDVCLDRKSGMVKACTGSGKTAMISRLIYEMNIPTVVYVVSLDLLDQMHETLSSCISEPIGMVGDGKCDIQKFTVCSAWTAGKAFGKKDIKSSEEDVIEDKWDPSAEQRNRIKEMVQNAKLVILDEAQFAAAESIKSILSNSTGAAHRFGFSGTPWRTDGDDILLEAAFGKNICDLKASKLIDLGFLVPGLFRFKDIPKFPTKLQKNWAVVKKNYVVQNEVRNQILIDATVKLLDMGRKPLILFREHAHGKIIREMIPSDVNYRYVTGKLKKDERKEIRDDFKAGKVDLIIASTIYDQGVDLPALDALVLAGGGKSTAKALQRVGRVIRGNKDGGKQNAIIVETFDQAHFVRNHSMMRWDIYQTEERFKFKIESQMAGFLARGRK